MAIEKDLNRIADALEGILLVVTKAGSTPAAPQVIKAEAPIAPPTKGLGTVPPPAPAPSPAAAVVLSQKQGLPATTE